jgi:polysaccharide export outer membrane protein
MKCLSLARLVLVQLGLALAMATSGWAAQQEAPQEPIAPRDFAAPVAEQPAVPAPSVVPDAPAPFDYVLGPGDVIAVGVQDLPEIDGSPLRIDPRGEVSLPLVGRVSVTGLAVGELEADLETRFRTYLKEPVVRVTVTEYGSQRVSVFGAVVRPGVHALEGRKTLIETLALAGGLAADAGGTIKITREAARGDIPLASAVKDATGQFSVAEVRLDGIVKATHPGDNIVVQPNDIISVPRAEIVYVIGAVQRAGGFTLNDRSTVSGLHALAMAQGLTNVASADNAVVIRTLDSGERIEIQAKLGEILEGDEDDIVLYPDDILFVPESATRSLFSRTLTTALSAITSIAIYSGF